MSKIEQISLGQKNKWIRLGSLFMIIFIAVISYLGFFYVKIPEYINLIVIANDEIILIDNNKSNLKNGRYNIVFENGKEESLVIQKKNTTEYKLELNSNHKPIINYIKEKQVSDCKVFIKETNLFNSLFSYK